MNSNHNLKRDHPDEDDEDSDLPPSKKQKIDPSIKFIYYSLITIDINHQSPKLMHMFTT